VYIRIAVNGELVNLEKGLRGSLETVKIGGRIAVLSYHSLEDRLVKVWFRAKEEEKRLKLITKKPLSAAFKEIKDNPRARSAKLRIAEKV
jgi:16S rRNA (cytosine1402-N4)-methyltransferase